jgi:hypothetical protein
MKVHVEWTSVPGYCANKCRQNLARNVSAMPSNLKRAGVWEALIAVGTSHARKVSPNPPFAPFS